MLFGVCRVSVFVQMPSSVKNGGRPEAQSIVSLLRRNENIRAAAAQGDLWKQQSLKPNLIHTFHTLFFFMEPPEDLNGGKKA